MSQQPLKERMVDYVGSLQSTIIKALEAEEPSAKFVHKRWQRPGGGGGDTQVLCGGDVFEKAGVNTSTVYGELTSKMQERFKSSTADFFATGLSLVIHPRSPQVPTVHANFRYFEQADRAWFGGGADLTPYVPYEEDATHFHQVLKKACGVRGPQAYSQFKAECDDYFYLKHREEHRGVGGVFFDYLSENLEDTFKFVQFVGDSFVEAYLPIVQRRKDLAFSERQKKFQLLWRGRYVEFNLVYDRGTLFGLETKGNIESILMSLPPEVNFDYSPDLEQTSEEKKLMSWVRNPKSWV